MNIIKAIGSGKQVKRKDWGTYIDLSKPLPVLTAEDITATDWVAVEQVVTVTNTALQTSWDQGVTPNIGKLDSGTLCASLGKALGLE